MFRIGLLSLLSLTCSFSSEVDYFFLAQKLSDFRLLCDGQATPGYLTCPSVLSKKIRLIWLQYQLTWVLEKNKLSLSARNRSQEVCHVSDMNTASGTICMAASQDP
jgi:hypothetical protein